MFKFLFNLAHYVFIYRPYRNVNLRRIDRALHECEVLEERIQVLRNKKYAAFGVTHLPDRLRVLRELDRDIRQLTEQQGRLTAEIQRIEHAARFRLAVS